MTEQDFIAELVDILELDESGVEMGTEIELDSMATMSVIAFLDENFSKKATADDLKNITSIGDIHVLASEGNIQ
eukprot:COSAG01_NODE_183_length_22835_cov_17.169247_10_plen_74_part_00